MGCCESKDKKENSELQERGFEELNADNVFYDQQGNCFVWDDAEKSGFTCLNTEHHFTRDDTKPTLYWDDDAPNVALDIGVQEESVILPASYGEEGCDEYNNNNGGEADHQEYSKIEFVNIKSKSEPLKQKEDQQQSYGGGGTGWSQAQPGSSRVGGDGGGYTQQPGGQRQHGGCYGPGGGYGYNQGYGAAGGASYAGCADGYNDYGQDAGGGYDTNDYGGGGYDEGDNYGGAGCGGKEKKDKKGAKKDQKTRKGERDRERGGGNGGYKKTPIRGRCGAGKTDGTKTPPQRSRSADGGGARGQSRGRSAGHCTAAPTGGRPSGGGHRVGNEVGRSYIRRKCVKLNPPRRPPPNKHCVRRGGRRGGRGR